MGGWPTPAAPKGISSTMCKMHQVTFIQYLAPEHGDDGPVYWFRKEVELPFIPSKEYAIEWSEMGSYVWHIQYVHYNIDEDRYYATFQSRWAQVWNGNEYDWEGTLRTMEHYVKFFKQNGWTVTEGEAMRNLTDYEQKVLSFIPKKPSWVTYKILARLVYSERSFPPDATASDKETAVQRACGRLHNLHLIAPVNSPRWPRWQKT